MTTDGARLLIQSAQSLREGALAAALSEARLAIGEFERDVKVAPDASAIHALSYCHGLAGEASGALDRLADAANHYEAMRRAFRLLGWLSRSAWAEHRDDIANYARWSDLYADVLHRLGSRLDYAVEMRLEAADLLSAMWYHEEAARALRDVADIERQLGRQEDAEGHARKALAKAQALDDPLLTASGWQGVGDCLRSQGRAAEAYEAFAQGYEILKKERGPVLDRAHAAGSMGETAQEEGQTQRLLIEAQQLYEEHLRTEDLQPSELSRAHYYLAQCLDTRAQLAATAGRQDEARELGIQSQHEYELAGDKMGTAQSVLSQAELSLLRGHLKDGLALARDAEHRFDTIDHPDGAFTARYLQAKVVWREDVEAAIELTAAIVALAESRQLQKATDQGRRLLADMHVDAARKATAARAAEHRVAAPGLLTGQEASGLQGIYVAESLADLARLDGDRPEALARYEEAAEAYRTRGDVREAACRFRQAEIYSEIAEWEECLSAGEAAVKAIDERRDATVAPVIGNEFGRAWEDIYLVPAKAARQLGRTNRAFAILTRLHGAVLRSTMVAGWKGLATSPDEENVAGRPVRVADPVPVRSARPEAGDLLDQAFTQNEATDRQRYRGGTGTAHQQPKARVATTSALDCLFLWSGDQHAALVRLPDGQVREFDYGETDPVAQPLETLAMFVGPHRSLADHLSPAFVACLGELRRRLWSPLRPMFGQHLPIRFMLPPALSMVPFVRFAAEDGMDSVLVGTFDSPINAKVEATSCFAVCSDPKSTLAGGPRRDLAIARAIFPSNGSVFVGDDEPSPANRLLTETGHFGTLLVSAHMTGEASAHLSGVNLAPDTSARPLSLFELLGTRCSADIVVLAGCESAIPSAGPELLSAASAVVAATGAKAAIATSWPVSDMGATLVWSELAKNIADAQDAGEALRSALQTLGGVDGADKAEMFVADLLRRVPALSGDRNLLVGALQRAIQLCGRGLLPADGYAWTVFGR